MSYFPSWKLKTSGTIAPDERLPAGQTLALGVQHVVAMFGSTVLAPLLMGFDPNLAILMSGLGTLIFFVLVAAMYRATWARPLPSTAWSLLQRDTLRVRDLIPIFPWRSAASSSAASFIAPWASSS